MFTFAITR